MKKERKFQNQSVMALGVDQWLRYASPESLSLFMFQKPKSAKKLFFDVIPKSVDEYSTFLNSFHSEKIPQLYNNPVWHIHNGLPPKFDMQYKF